MRSEGNISTARIYGRDGQCGRESASRTATIRSARTSESQMREFMVRIDVQPDAIFGAFADMNRPANAKDGAFDRKTQAAMVAATERGVLPV